MAYKLVSGPSSAGEVVDLNPVGALADVGMSRIEKKVAADAVAQYEIAKRGGSAIDTCVHAGFVAAAYLQAKDEPNYRTWKQTEKGDCARAGAPQP